MNNQTRIEVAEIIGSQQCISAKNAQKVFNKIEQSIKNEKQVIVSFENITLILSFFFNIAIGQLYGSFSKDTIRNYLKVEGLSTDDMGLLKIVVDNAKKYHFNKKF